MNIFLSLIIFYMKLLVLSIHNSHLSEGSKIHMLNVYHLSLPDPPSILSYAPAVPYGYIRVSPVSSDFGLLGVMELLAGNLKSGNRKGQGVYLPGFLLSGLPYVVSKSVVYSCPPSSMNFLIFEAWSWRGQTYNSTSCLLAALVLDSCQTLI